MERSLEYMGLKANTKISDIKIDKVVIGSFIFNHSSKRYMKGINVFLTFTIINNYEHM